MKHPAMIDRSRFLTILLVCVGLVFLGILGWLGYGLYAQKSRLAVETLTPTLPVILPTNEDGPLLDDATEDPETVTDEPTAPSYLRGTIVDLPTGAVTLDVDVPVGSPVRTLTVLLTADTTLAVQETTVDRVPGAEDLPAVESATTALAVGDTIVVYSGSPIPSNLAEVTATKIELLR